MYNHNKYEDVDVYNDDKIYAMEAYGGKSIAVFAAVVVVFMLFLTLVILPLSLERELHRQQVACEMQQKQGYKITCPTGV